MADEYADYKSIDLSQYDDEVIAKAFWLQEHIRRYGIQGIYFSETALGVARTRGPDIVADSIGRELKKL